MGHRRDEMLISAGLKLHAIDAQITHPNKQWMQLEREAQ